MRKALRYATIAAIIMLIPLPASAISVQINDDGFGKDYNEYAWAMKSYGGYLYVGTQNPNEGGEIWRYAPESGWEQLVAGGLGNIENMGVRTFVEFKNRLYASTNNHETGGEVWRMSEDRRGVAWERVMEPGFGTPDNTSIRGLVVYDGYLYAGTYNFPTGYEVWRSPDGDNWERILEGGFGSVYNFAAAVMTVHHDKLLVGTWNMDEGLEIWEWSDADGWEMSAGCGFGDPHNWNAVSMKLYKGDVYVGTGNMASGAEVWRFSDGSGWEKVGPGGFGNPYNVYHWYMETYRGRLYVGTMDFKWFGFAGHELWSYHDVQGWKQIAAQGFGDRNNYGLRSMAEYMGDLYIGTANTGPGKRRFEGCEVWRYDRETVHANLYPMPDKALLENVFFFDSFLKLELMLPCGYDLSDIKRKDMRITRINDTDTDVGSRFYYTFWGRSYILFPKGIIEPLLEVGRNEIYVEGIHGSGEIFGGVAQLTVNPSEP